jgi:hypothetical protein
LAIALIEAADCCGISAEKDDADQRAGNANPPHSLVLSIALKESFNGDGAVVSYLNDVRRTMALASAFANRSSSHYVTSGDGRNFIACSVTS